MTILVTGGAGFIGNDADHDRLDQATQVLICALLELASLSQPVTGRFAARELNPCVNRFSELPPDKLTWLWSALRPITSSLARASTHHALRLAL